MNGWNRARRSHLALVIGVLLALVLTGCTGSRTPRPLVVMLVDVTASTASARQQYLEAFDRVLDTLPDGGRVVVLPIDVDSAVNPIALDASLPKLQRWSLDPKAGNDRTHKQAREAVRQQAREAINRLLEEQPTTRPGTAIIEAVAYAGRIFGATPDADPYLVILSDMIEQSEFDFTTMPEAELETVVARLKEERRLPALGFNAKVYVAGVAAGEAGTVRLPDQRLRAIDKFWQKFFQATGASVKWYGPSLVNFCVAGTTSCGT